MKSVVTEATEDPAVVSISQEAFRVLVLERDSTDSELVSEMR